MQEEPLLSVAVGTRNDDYGGNSLWRLETCLNHLAANLERLDRPSEVEVVITDWGSKEPLHEVTKLSFGARRMVRWIVVPPSLARQLEGDSEFPVVLAQNTAIRRGRGRYIAQMDADILLTARFLEKLFPILEGEVDLGLSIDHALVVAQRRNVPYILSAGSPNGNQLEWLIDRFGRLMPGENLDTVPYFGTGFILMHRVLWQQCGAFDEGFMYRGLMETDLGSRVTQRYPCFLLNKAGLSVYHLAHYTFFHGFTSMRKHNRPKPSALFHPNDENWGLRLCKLEEYDGTTPSGGDAIAPGTVSEKRLRVLSPRLILAVIALVCPALLRKTVPASIRALPMRAFVTAGLVWLLLRGKPPVRWPVVLWDFWRERRRRQREMAAPQ